MAATDTQTNHGTNDALWRRMGRNQTVRLVILITGAMYIVAMVYGSGMRRQVKTLQTTPPTPAELARAQHYLIGSYAVRHERLEDRASLLGAAELSAPDGYKLDTDYSKYIDAVSAADVQRVAAKYLIHPVVATVEPDAANPQQAGQ